MSNVNLKERDKNENPGQLILNEHHCQVRQLRHTYVHDDPASALAHGWGPYYRREGALGGCRRQLRRSFTN